MRQKKWSDEETAKLLELKSLGLKTSQIATMLGRTPDSIGMRLRALGFGCRKIRQWTDHESPDVSQPDTPLPPLGTVERLDRLAERLNKRQELFSDIDFPQQQDEI